MLTRFHIATLSIVAVVVTGDAFQTPPPARQWPPAVQKISTSAPVLSPTEALATFSLPSGYRLELVASEPMIQDPVAIDWDASGRLWAIELPGYMRDMMSTGEYDATGRIVVLEDKNDDGIMDTRTVFADGLIQPRGLKVLDRGALVGEPPNVWLLKDNDRDLHVDGKELVTIGYGRRETNVEVNANGLYWALDNRIYAAGIGVDMYFRWQGGRIETQKSLSRGQWGLTQDDAGRIYRNHNESVLHVDLIPTPYFARNPSLLRTRGSHEMLIDAGGEVNAVWPSRQTPGTNRAYQSGVLRADGTLAAFTAACAPTVYRGDRLPTDLQGNVFVAEPAANLVSRIILRDDATTLRARKGYDGGSSSPRPTSDSDRCICRVLPMALSMSSTCIAASSNIAPTSRNICAIRSSRASSNSPSAWAVSIASCTRPRGGMPGRVFRVPRPRSWSRRFRIRTAGGAIRRSSCSSNVVIGRPWRRS